MDKDNALEKMAQSRLKMAEETKEKAIGAHVIFLIRRDGEISMSALVSSLKSEADSLSSAPQYDLTKLQTEAALAYLRDELDRRGRSGP